MNDNKLVSVIVPVYNVKKYLKECVTSIINQTYKSLEIILVDDGSTDGSGLICDSFSVKDKRIKVIHKNNSGLGYSRNAAIKIAKGEYVYFIDSDDFIGKDTIASLMLELQRHSCDTVIGGYTRVSDEGITLYSRRNNSKNFSDKEVKLNLLPRLLGSSATVHDSIRMSVWNVIFSMRIIRNNEIKFPSERDYLSEDILWDIDYYSVAKKVRIMDSVSYIYRKHGNTLTTKRFNYYKRFLMIKKLYFFEKEKLSKLCLLSENNERLEREFFINLSSCFRELAVNERVTYAIKSIRKLMNDKIVRKLILNYPYKRTNLKARIYLTLIRNKNAILMFLLMKHA